MKNIIILILALLTTALTAAITYQYFTNKSVLEEIESFKEQTKEYEQKITILEEEKANIETKYKVELQNSLSRSASAQAMNEVLEVDYPEIKLDFKSAHFQKYVELCTEIEKEAAEQGEFFLCT